MNYPQTILSCVFFVMVLGAKMSLNLKSLSVANAWLEMLTRTETDLHAQFLELIELRERLREAQLSADLQSWRGLESPRQFLSPLSPATARQPLPVTLRFPV